MRYPGGFLSRAFRESVAMIASVLVRFIGMTSRTRILYHPESQSLIETHRTFIYAFWHRYQLFPPYDRQNRGASVLVSQSKDGDLIARFAKYFGIDSIRGSTTRGGTAAMREIMRHLRKKGGRLGLTPDGPKGPLRSVNPGIVIVAKRTGVPIVPVAWYSSRILCFNSWDRFLVPLPFGRAVIIYGKPFSISQNESLEGAMSKIKHSLESVELEAVEACAPKLKGKY